MWHVPFLISDGAENFFQIPLLVTGPVVKILPHIVASVVGIVVRDRGPLVGL